MLQKYKRCYAVRSRSHRPDFPGNMTAEELAIMDRHAEFWDKLLLDGNALIPEPVQDSNGTYGFADSEDAARELLEDDPARKLSDYSYTPVLVNYDAK